jgi:cysteine-rich repeat protein
VRIAAVSLLSLLLLAAARPADAAVLHFLEAHKNGDPGISGLIGAESIAASPDGAHVYVGGSVDDSLVTFSRDPATGTLSFVGALFNGGGIAGLDGVRAVAVSPDGNHVYTGGYTDDAVGVFSRNTTTGALTFVEAKKNGSGGITSLNGPNGVTISPDGAHVYVASAVTGSVTVFSRNQSTGTLTLVAAYLDGFGGITSLAGAETLVVSRDGKNVYVAAQDDDAVTVFSRNQTTGSLSLVEFKKDGVDGVDGLDWVQGVAVSDDGAHVYTASHLDRAVAVFSRNEATGALTFVEAKVEGQGGVDGLNGAEWVTVAPDGFHVYAVSDVEHSLVVFDRDSATGMLTPADLYVDGGSIDGLAGASEVVSSPDGRHVYVASSLDDAVAVFEKLCGNGIVDDPEEECDDGNLIDGDCCSATCTAEASGTPCTDDANICTDDKCNGAGLCLHVNNSIPCDDGNFCTVNDACQDRLCQGDPRDCSGLTSEQCMEGVCNEATDECVVQPKTDGSTCDDGNPCMLTDTCQSGECVGSNPLVCTAADQCHAAGVCDLATGICSHPAMPDGTLCDDGDLCTQTDTCQAGVCIGTNPVVCTALDQCHLAGVCNPATGVCSDPQNDDDTPCDDGDLCTQTDTCQAGACAGSNPVICTALDQCHDPGV